MSSRRKNEALETATALGAFRRACGLPLCKQVARFRSTRLQYLMLACLQRIPALEQHLDNPGLFFHMCSSVADYPDVSEAAEQVRRYASLPRRAMVRELALPSAAFLHKIRPEAITRRRLAGLLAIPHRSRAFRTMSHLPELGASAVNILTNQRLFDQVESAFLVELAERKLDRFRPRIARNLSQLIHVSEQVGQKREARYPTIASLQNAYNRWFGYIEPYETEFLLPLRFPEPPIESDDGFIEPIRSFCQLLLETVQMENCCASRAEHVLEGSLYYYRVLPRWGMTRATMELVPSADDPHIWRLSEVKGPKNCSMPPNLIRCLAIWLAQKQRVEDERYVLPDSLHSCLC